MRNGQNKRMRGRNNNNNNRKNHNPLTRVYESNGPDVKIRGTASHIAEKYIQLARDAQGSGDPVAAENYYQHAEHYFRLIAAAQEQFRQSNQLYRPEGAPDQRNDESFDDGDDNSQQPHSGGVEPHYAPRDNRDPQHFQPRDSQPFQPRDSQSYQPRESQPHFQPRENQPFQPRESQPHQGYQGHQPRPQHQQAAGGHEVGLPSFITGGAPIPPQNGQDQNGHDNQPDRFPLHRRRRRHRGPRSDLHGGQGVTNDGPDDGAV